jgi:hypothetical protein
MGAFGTIAAAIRTDLLTVANIGVVLDSAPLPPMVEDWAEFVGTFTATIGGKLQVRAWTVAFAGTRVIPGTTRRGLGSHKELREVRYLIRGYLGRLHPDSEATFRDLIEEVVVTLDLDHGLGGTVLDHDDVEVDLPDNADAILLGDVVCHYCEITVVTRVELTLTA